MVEGTEHRRTVAITGATGTLGIALIQECVKHDMPVIAFVHRGSPNEKRIPVHPLLKKVSCSLDEMEQLDVSDLQADIFIHLAWGSTNRQVRNQLKPQVDNIRYALDSVELADRMGCSVYVGAGSQAEYGNTEELLNENTATYPKTAYGMAKLCTGQMTRLECKKRGIRHIWPRILSTYGPYTQDTTILNYSIRCMLKGEVPQLTKCEQIWDFLYVEDAARALLMLAEYGRDGEVYCVSSGQSKTLREYLEITRSQVAPEAKIGFGALPYGEDTVMCLRGDIAKLTRDTGFAPRISFEEGIAKTIEWARAYYMDEAAPLREGV